jgi:hypothetical protein
MKPAYYWYVYAYMYAYISLKFFDILGLKITFLHKCFINVGPDKKVVCNLSALRFSRIITLFVKNDQNLKEMHIQIRLKK